MKKKKWIIIGIIAFIVLLIVLIPVMIFMALNRLQQATSQQAQNPSIEDEIPYSDRPDYGSGDYGIPDYGSGEFSIPGFDDEYGDYGQGESGSESTATGIDMITAYIQDGLSIQVEEEQFTFMPDDKKTTYVNFEVHYPKLSGMKDEKLQEKINNRLMECAKESYGRIYESPNLEIKERVLSQSQPVLADYVKYKVSYLSEDFLCVVFEDYTYEGSMDATYVGLRAVNISLKDGTEYEVNDIVNVDHAFLERWDQVMNNEAGTTDLLSELNEPLKNQILTGKRTVDGTYLPVFFVDRDGIEIGLSFHYSEGDTNKKGYGWVTAPFTLEELKEYKKDSIFWEYVK